MKITVGISNRHVHITKEDLITLFGKEELTWFKNLKQPGQFASDEKVSIKTEKGQLDNLRILGPTRNYTQVEVSKTDCFTLGINPPVRTSGDLEGAAELTIIGPKGQVTKNCAIIANRHIHINKEQRKEFGLEGIDVVKVKTFGEKSTTFDNVYIKEAEPSYFEIHLDTDDANASLLKNDEEVEIIIK